MSRRHQERKGPIVDLFNEQSGFCCYCSGKMTLKLGKRHTATIEHIVPKSKGGPNAAFNYAAAHASCNQEKGDTNLLVFLSKRRVPAFSMWDH